MVSHSHAIADLITQLTTMPFSREGLRSELERRFAVSLSSAIAAAELAERHMPALMEQLETQLSVWDSEAVPRPLEVSSHGSVAYGVYHPKYSGGLPSHYFDVLEFVFKANESVLLGITTLYLIDLGCDMVFVTDKGGGDAGVDVLGRKYGARGAPHVLIAVQCKAEAKSLGPVPVDAIADRFRHGLEEKKQWADYFRTSVASDLRLAPGILFGVLATKGLSGRGSQRALERGIFSSSPRQIAYSLACNWDLDSIDSFCHDIPSTRNLSRNLVPEAPQRL